MFFMWIFYAIGALGFAWIIWSLLVKPMLKDSGISIEEEMTEYIQKRDDLRAQFDLMEKSAQAADEGVELARDIKYYEDRIADAERRMKEI